MVHISDDPEDPFVKLLEQEIQGETPAQTTARLKRESDAQRISDEIDERIKNDRAVAKRESAVVKVLLLGQAESGKSTTLKNFRMRYDTEAWEKERHGWRAVVQLNIVRSILTILAVINAELSGEIFGESQDDGAAPDELTKFTDSHKLLMIRLAPLRDVESNLQRWLGAGAELLSTSGPMAATPFETPVYSSAAASERGSGKEFVVRRWHDVLDPDARQPGHSNPDFESVTITLAGYRDDMKLLWEDRVVQRALARRKLILPDSAGFFLNELDRIATRQYVVTDDDIVRARLRTVGIQEYRLRFKDAPLDAPKINGAWEWRIYDVGGCRTNRPAWLPFFENTNVIIFLCPVSCFDERLEEDRRVNRLEDSLILWRSICTSKLLTKTQLILFMNKCDLLKLKLKHGTRIKDHLTSYGDRPNEVMDFVKYLREKFKEILKQNSPAPRKAYIYPTTVTDTQATAKTLALVRDGIFRENLARSHLI
ncbi:hypothetical protein GYMLUDRAFT_230926 [Collybiopsis luxurians FD-317 M1]|uniref:Guanine nucleotide-binding protein alpha-4 subunit n=1 Tax=Collybiopsis luxurians FD-317 M1 TaxID=944289 RepID=A0A0D0C008_9AGAR|nr:hypothetical protein GYMLUDRAFT_230926 [Collybiopsis luxurians FD-317 M1]